VKCSAGDACPVPRVEGAAAVVLALAMVYEGRVRALLPQLARFSTGDARAGERVGR